MLLLALVLAPLAAALIVAFAHGGDDERAGAATWRLALLLALLIAGGSLAVLLGHGGTLAVPWWRIPGTNAIIHLRLASDGLSAWLAALVAWLMPVALLAARGEAGGRMREYAAALFAAEAAMLGALFARDLALFAFCYEAMLIPVVVVLALFGGYERRSAALWFVLMTMLGSVPMLIAVWAIAAETGTTAFNEAAAALRAGKLDAATLEWWFWAFALAFAVKIPLVPLHAWQARTYAELPAGAGVLVAGAMAKLGLYGFLAIVLPLFPALSREQAPLFLLLGTLGAVGGAVVAFAQEDAKRLIAYASLSHLGLTAAGVFSLQAAAIDGATVQMIAHGLSTAALFVLVGALEQRTQSPYLDDHGALARRAPWFATLLVLSVLATAALPGTANFAGEFLLLMGLWQRDPWWAAIAGLSVVLGAGYLLILVQKWCFGEAPEGRAEVNDLLPREVLAVVPLLLGALWFGFQPGLIARHAGADANALCEPARATQPAASATTSPSEERR
ncbi:MAG: NADH-quinone oxidoreductase subunit M [Planctomycetota bacterium]|nr:NADH-quinone oxidoreductase subunit M [Planctomycetota bacterium]